VFFKVQFSRAGEGLQPGSTSLGAPLLYSLIFSGQAVQEDEGTTAFKTRGTTCLMKQCNIPDDLNLQNVKIPYNVLQVQHVALFSHISKASNVQIFLFVDVI
jgi:hypothetical protein